MGSSIDGNNNNPNNRIIKEYYFNDVYNSINYKIGENSYKIIAKSIDSLSWNNEIIVAYANEKYIYINISNNKIEQHKVKIKTKKLFFNFENKIPKLK